MNCGFVFWESFGNGSRLLCDPEEPGDEKFKVNMQLEIPSKKRIYANVH